MKKVMAVFMICILAFAVASCGNTKEQADNGSADIQEEGNASDIQEDSGAADIQEDNNAADAQENGSAANGDRILIAYFSWAKNAALEENVDAVSSPSVLVPGNVEQLAEWVQEKTAGELFPLQVSEPYSSDWDACLSRANQEKADGIRPGLKETVKNMGEYDILFLGFPNWWYSCPMAVIFFLEAYDFTGKQVYLFCSHGSGGLAGSVQDIEDVLQGAEISDHVFDIYEENAASSQEEIRDWLEELGY